MRAEKGTQTSNIGALNRSGNGNGRLTSIVVIDRQSLFCECFVRSLESLSDHTVISFATAEHWLEASDGVSASLILLFARSKEETHHEIALLSQSPASHPPVIIVSDDDDLDQIVEMLDKGVRGCIPTSAPLSEVMAAIRLVNAGGTFVPASSLKVVRRSAVGTDAPKPIQHTALTTRQGAVLELLGRGKPNKIIAYELCMAESTVKVHIRIIMKKFGARNRTQLAFLANNATGLMAT